MLWRKAANDLDIARVAIEAGVALDLAGFHAQQAVEKSLKAILALHDVDYPKSHAIGKRIGLAKPLIPVWPFEDEQLDGLTKYAVDVRYDDSYTEANLAEAREALDTAEMVHHRVGTMIGPAQQAPDESTEG